MAAATKEQVTAAVKAVAAIAEAIKELGSVPSGHLYAQLMGQLSLQQYERIIDTLCRADLVSNKGNLLTWIGPKP